MCIKKYNDDLPGEVWVTYKDFQNYKISNMGRVKELEENRVFLQRKISSTSYAQVSLIKNGATFTFKLHRLVLSAFKGDCPEKGYVCCHINGLIHDNRLDNLRWATMKQNMADKVEHGKGSSGSKNPNAKLSEEDVIHIRSIPTHRGVIKKLASYYCVSYATIHGIRKNNTWKNI